MPNAAVGEGDGMAGREILKNSGPKGRRRPFCSSGIIAVGTPQEVRHNPLVVESYLSGDLRAIERSGVLAAVVTSRDDQMVAVGQSPEPEAGASEGVQTTATASSTRAQAAARR